MRRFVQVIFGFVVIPFVLVAQEAKPKHANELVEGINGFSVALYKQLAASPGNVVVSPFNMSTSLSMAYLGARGATAIQMENVLGYPADTPEELAKAFEELMEKLRAGSGDALELSLANSMWIDKRMPVLFLFKSLVNRAYQGGIMEVSFQNPASATEEINTWVSGETKGRITDLLQPGSLNAQSRLVLVSAIYMQAKWMQPFNPTRTRNQPFHVTSQKQVQAPMMNGQMQLLHSQEPGYTLAALPYKHNDKGPHLVMVLLLPEEKDGLAAMEEAMSAQEVVDVLMKARVRGVDITMPKFKLSNRIYARKILEQMGLTDPFLNSANFSGITGRQDLSIDAVIHQAFIDVDEAGTEAAAATAVGMGVKSIRQPDIAFNADHPFVYMIMDNETKQILFMGRVVNPVGEE